MGQITQDRTITMGEYTFDEKNHLHMLEGKPLTGVTTILGVIAKPMLIQWAANMACDYTIDNSAKEIITEDPVTKEKIWTGNYIVAEEVIKQARKAHTKKKEAAGEWGTEVHNEIEKIINGAIADGVINWTGAAEIGNKEKAIINFINWAQINNVKFLSSEKHLYSRKWWVGGIADIICEIDGKRYIGDIKTSSGIYPEHFVQCSAYAKMAEEMGLYTGKDLNTHPVDHAYYNIYLKEPTFHGVIIINLKKDGGFDTRTFMDVEQGAKVFESAVNIYRFKESVK